MNSDEVAVISYKAPLLAGLFFRRKFLIPSEVFTRWYCFHFREAEFT